jgi:hypothetical protein
MGISTYLFRGEKYLRGVLNKHVGRSSPLGFHNPDDRLKIRRSENRQGEGGSGARIRTGPLLFCSRFSHDGAGDFMRSYQTYPL